MLDLLVTNATLPDGRTHMAVAVQDGRIVEVAECLQAPAAETLDAVRCAWIRFRGRPGAFEEVRRTRSSCTEPYQILDSRELAGVTRLTSTTIATQRCAVGD